ncbi:MAG: isoprenylcysteine carboxylmethyltransferase family protein [Bacteroidales bacterium]|nr:isoprenylcysteine carboxylmethyltransferase family protein [Bacteroidales bacterium]MBN2698387.1 isoprenylcysteine carboxylmethyltransferase family protein [Bacteroidales bacterium]
MKVKKHKEHPHLTGEHPWGDTIQLMLFFIFIAVYILDSFFFEISIFLTKYISNTVRVPIAILIFVMGSILAVGASRKVFISKHSEPEVIRNGVFGIVRHPLYLGVILFYLAAVILSLSIISFALWILIVVFYYLISNYEEKLLNEAFGEKYRDYKESTGMFFPKICSRSKLADHLPKS